MSTKQQHKQKLNELAKDLNISNQELIDFIKKNLMLRKKASASLENEEVNKILEIFTLDRQVDSFNEYFALRNKPAAKPVKKNLTQQAEKKKPVNKAKVKDEAATVQSKEQPKQPVNNTEPVKKSAEHPAQVKNTQQPEKPVQHRLKSLNKISRVLKLLIKPNKNLSWKDLIISCKRLLSRKINSRITLLLNKNSLFSRNSRL
jgi:hypothetical protein